MFAVEAKTEMRNCQFNNSMNQENVSDCNATKSDCGSISE